MDLKLGAPISRLHCLRLSRLLQTFVYSYNDTGLIATLSALVAKVPIYLYRYTYLASIIRSGHHRWLTATRCQDVLHRQSQLLQCGRILAWRSFTPLRP